MWNARMRFSRFELRGRLKQQIRFQTAFYVTRSIKRDTDGTIRVRYRPKFWRVPDQRVG